MTSAAVRAHQLRQASIKSAFTPSSRKYSAATASGLRSPRPPL